MKTHSFTPDTAALGFAALGSEQRLLVIGQLVRAGAAGQTIGALGAAVGISGATLTHHLRALVQAGLVSRQQEGRAIRLRVDHGRVQALSE